MSDTSEQIPHVTDELYQRSPELMNTEERIATALAVIAEFGISESEHQKAYTIDQVLRVLTGCPVVTITPPNAHEPYTCDAFGESPEYLAFVEQIEAVDEDELLIEWDTGQPD